MARSRFLVSEKGVAMVELAFALPVLLLIVWGIIDFARLFSAATSLSSAVREGARYAAVEPGNTSGIKTAVMRGFQPLGGTPLTASDITVVVDTSTPTTARGDTVRVEVPAYQWRAITPLSTFMNGSLARHATFRWERASP